jgi:hypothetical protein
VRPELRLGLDVDDAEAPVRQGPDQERLQRWLESLDPDDLGYKM